MHSGPASVHGSAQRRAGRKGFGLFALEDIKQGQFVIEYIGERWLLGVGHR